MSEWYELCQKDDIKEGSVKVFETKGQRIALCRVENDGFYAVQDVCTHDDGPLGEGELIDFAIECPRHGARFDVRTGRVLALPAVVPISTYPIKIENGMVKVELS